MCIAVFDIDFDAGRRPSLRVPFGPFTLTESDCGAELDALAERDRFLGYARHRRLLSGDEGTGLRRRRPAVRACESVMMPLEVEMIATPRPPSTFGSASLPR
jgi:hypothetical protein